MRRLAFALLVTAVTAGCAARRPRAPAATSCARGQAWLHGRWYRGAGEFVARAMWSCDGDGTLREAPPAAVVATHDLGGGFVVPPFAEGHNHWLEPASVDAYVARYLTDGVFYLKDMANAPVIRASLEARLNRPTTVDFISANQGFTGPGGHPLEIMKQLLGYGRFPRGWTEADLVGNALFIVANEDDIARAWPRFVDGKPDLLKLFLLYSDEYEARLHDPKALYHRGLDPRLVAPLVARAHAAGLRVAAHIYDAADFRNAVAGGVDELAHFPGTGWDAKLGPARFRITDDDARAAARRRVTVTTTLAWLNKLAPAEQRLVLDDVIRPNWRALRAAGVTLLVGSDQFRQSSAVEAEALVRFGLMTPRELLEAWAVTTPQSIFPRRRLGRLADGYEASFLVLDDDPTRDFAATRRIRVRVKQGHVVEPTPTPMPPLPE